MKAAIMQKPFDMIIADVPMPELKPNEVIIRITMAGICGSDVHHYDGSNPYSKYPFIFGHELTGVVEQTGPGATRFKPGDRVIIEPTIPCGYCYPCRIGKGSCCANMNMVGTFRQGGFAEFMSIPERCLYPTPENMDDEIAALCEPFSIGAHVVQLAGLKEGATVTILGAGPIGITILILLKRYHNCKVYISDILPERLEYARWLGADVAINAREQDMLKTIAELTNGEGSNVVIESAGLKMTMEQTIHLVSHGGRIVIVGITGDNVSFPGVLFTRKEVEIYGSRNYGGMFPEVISFLSENPELARTFISMRMPFTDIAEALHLAKTKPNEVNKIILTY